MRARFSLISGLDQPFIVSPTFSCAVFAASYTPSIFATHSCRNAGVCTQVVRVVFNYIAAFHQLNAVAKLPRL